MDLLYGLAVGIVVLIVLAIRKRKKACDFSHTFFVCRLLFIVFVFGLCGVVRCHGNQLFLQICNHEDGSTGSDECKERDDHRKRAFAEDGTCVKRFTFGSIAHEGCSALIIEDGISVKFAILEAQLVIFPKCEGIILFS